LISIARPKNYAGYQISMTLLSTLYM